MRTLMLLMVGLVAGCALVQSASQSFTIKVVNEQNKPVADAIVTVYEKSSSGGRSEIFRQSWRKTDANGKAIFSDASRYRPSRGQTVSSTSWEVAVRGPGYLPHREIVKNARLGTTHTIMLKRSAKTFTLVLRSETGQPIPEDLQPVILDSSDTDESNEYEWVVFEYKNAAANDWQGGRDAAVRRIYGQFMAERISSGRYRISLPAQFRNPLLLIIHHEGFLRTFATKISAEQVRQGRAEITLPKPFTARVHFDTTRRSASEKKLVYSLKVPFWNLQVLRDICLEEGLLPNGKVTTLEWDDFCGEINVSMQSLEGNVEWQTPAFNPFNLVSDDNRELTLTYKPLDAEGFRGNLTHTVQVYRADGAPASGKPCRLMVANENIVIAEQILDSQGRAVFKNLREATSYSLEVDGHLVGALEVSEYEDQPSTFRVPLCVGDPMPELELTDLRTGERVRLRDFKGKWVYLSFCDPVLNKRTLQRIVEERDRVEKELHHRLALLAVVPAPTNYTDHIEAHLKEGGIWGKVRCCRVDPQTLYDLDPRTQLSDMLIAPSGVIAWMGNHPPLVNSVIDEIVRLMELPESARKQERVYTVRVRVIDDQSRPVPNASVSVHQPEYYGGRSKIFKELWQKTDADGVCTFQADREILENNAYAFFSDERQSWAVNVSAAGYLPYTGTLSPPRLEATYTIVLKRGARAFELVLRNETGKPLPDNLEPAVIALPRRDQAAHIVDNYWEDEPGKDAEHPSIGRIHSQFGVESLGAGRYRVSLPEKFDAPLLVIIYHKGFLRAFAARIPAEQVRRGYAELTLPKPFRAQIRFDTTITTDTPESLAYSLVFSFDHEEQWLFSLPIDSETLPDGQIITKTWDDLGGDVTINLFRNLGGTLTPYASKPLEPSSEGVARLELSYRQPRPELLRGNLTHTVHVKRADGTPAKGLPYVVTAEEAEQSIIVTQGVLDAEGRATIQNLRGDVDYQLAVDNEEVGHFILNDPEHRHTSFRISYREGDSAPDLTLTDLDTDKQFRLSEFKGKWVYIILWATWCDSCEDILKWIGEESDEIEEVFKGKVVLLTISLDESTKPIKPYLEKVGAWGKARHCWSGAGKWDSPASRKFMLDSIPLAVLIDPAGKIAEYTTPLMASLLYQIAEKVDPSILKDEP
ncbi:MAG: redoxin domain-containing protein [Fimbriimonadales bacterium]|nr:MAG: hypothetical protein KatS3mg018_1714 [Fimbriimonadales bacterium]